MIIDKRVVHIWINVEAVNAFIAYILLCQKRVFRVLKF